MAGRRSKPLSPEDIRRLKEYRDARRLAIPQLKLAMDAPFKWQVLVRALAGDPIWELNHKFIVEWLDVCCPKKQASLFDGKAAASGEREKDAAPGEPTPDEVVQRERV